MSTLKRLPGAVRVALTLAALALSVAVFNFLVWCFLWCCYAAGLPM